jgi:hypothetical protein
MKGACAVAELPVYLRNFVAASAFEAVYITEQGEQTLLVEVRRKPDGKMLLFTVVDGQQVREGSIQEFILTHQACKSLCIRHTVHVLWNSTPKTGELLEIFVPEQDVSRGISVRLRLTIASTAYETDACATLTEALMELDDVIGSETDWWLQICHDCYYSAPAFLFPVDDRDDLRCYRDAPDVVAEVRDKGKFASPEALYAGSYFVNAFHTCAAWRRRKTPVGRGS